jgi:hypothetical protein
MSIETSLAAPFKKEQTAAAEEGKPNQNNNKDQVGANQKIP